jgi:Questin oxidase-like
MSTQIRPVPDELSDLLGRHAAAYATHYPPVDNADHGPMAYLAMHGLGIGLDRIRSFAETYQRRLVAYPPPREVVSRDRWRDHVGHRESYAALREFFTREIEELGWHATVTRYLPSLLSGWVKDAFHPLIRLGYGVEFEVPTEVAAGLAYFAIVGDDPALLALAHKGQRVDAEAYFATARGLRDERFARGPFNDRYRRILRSVAPPAADADDVLRTVSRHSLDAFDATHDFFALHLVTSSHAFRICRPLVADAFDAAVLDDLFSIGIVAAYLAIGAPAFPPTDPQPMALPLAALGHTDDEHDIKLAYSCRAQQRAFGDHAYESLGARYLAGRLPAAS